MEKIGNAPPAGAKIIPSGRPLSGRVHPVGQEPDVPAPQQSFLPDSTNPSEQVAVHSPFPPRSASDLNPDLSKIATASQLIKQFSGDLFLVGNQLGSGKEAFAFFQAYAQHFASLGGSKLPGHLTDFQTLLQQTGFSSLRESKSGMDGLRVAKQVLAMDSPAEIVSHARELEWAPTHWPPQSGHGLQVELNPEAWKLANALPHAESNLPLPEVKHPPVPKRKLLWGVLSTFYSDDKFTAVENAEWDRRIFTAFLGLLAISLLGVAISQLF